MNKPAKQNKKDRQGSLSLQESSFPQSGSVLQSSSSLQSGSVLQSSSFPRSPSFPRSLSFPRSSSFPRKRESSKSSGNSRPKGWCKMKLDDVYNISAGGDFNTKTSSPIQDANHPYPIYSNALTNKGLYGYSAFAKYPADSITITARGEIGFANYRNTKFVAVGRVLVLKNKIPIMNQFVSYYINHKIKFLKETTGVPQLTVPQAGSYYILFPKLLEEQKAIAGLLGTWDRAIEKTEELIALKERQFKWLLRKLITDQQKNPTWQKVKLGDVGIISSSGVDKKIIDNEKKVRLVNYLDVLNKDFIVSDDLNHWVTAPDRKITQCNVQKGDIFFTPSSEIQGDIAHSAVAMEDMQKVVYSYHIVRFRLKEKWDLIFRAYIFKSSQFYHQAYKLCEGSGQRYVISQDNFRNMTISIPPLKKQKHIAEILKTAQKELDLLKDLVIKYREQKKGLMQKLLTGHWRLKL